MQGSNELREIKKEIIEARGLIIKSNNLANSLSSELRSIAKRQASYERNMTFNSIGAYVIFVVLVMLTVVFGFNRYKASLEEDKNEFEALAAANQAELAALKKEKKTDKKTRGEDLEKIFELIHSRQREEAIKLYEGIDPEVLTDLEGQLLSSQVEGFRFDLSMQHYAKGLEHIGKKRWSEAVEELRESLRLKDDAGHAVAAKLQLGNALRLQGKPREAIAVLQRLIEEHLERDLADDAHWYLGLAHYDAHQKDEARAVMMALQRQFPDSQYFRDARIKAAEIRLKLWRKDDD